MTTEEGRHRSTHPDPSGSAGRERTSLDCPKDRKGKEVHRLAHNVVLVANVPSLDSEQGVML